MMRELVMSASHLTALRDHLLEADGLERFAYVFCTPSGDDRLVAADVRPVPDDELRLQGHAEVGPTQAYERSELERCVDNGYMPLGIHSHPFSDHAGFSGIDVEMMDDQTAWLQALEPDVDIAYGVIGREDVDATVYDAETERFRDLPVTVIGDWTLDTPVPTTDEIGSVDPALYDRAIRFLTEEGQQRIAATTVAIVGTGGLGFPLAKQLARLGVQKLVLVDHDHIERSNLNRLPGTTVYDVGRPKVSVLAHHLHNSGLDVEVEAVPERVEDATTALQDCDVIFGTVDEVSTRSYLNQYAVKHLRYYVDAGSIIRTDDGQVTDIAGVVQLVAPGVNACYACLGRGDPQLARREQLTDEELQADVDAGYVEEAALAPEPAIGTLNGTVASHTAAVFTRLVAGYASPPDMVRYEELAWDLAEVTTRRDPACPTCGEAGLLGQGDRDPQAGDTDGADTDLDKELELIEDWTDDGATVAEDTDQQPDRTRVAGLLDRARVRWPGLDRVIRR